MALLSHSWQASMCGDFVVFETHPRLCVSRFNIQRKHDGCFHVPYINFCYNQTVDLIRSSSELFTEELCAPSTFRKFELHGHQRFRMPGVCRPALD